MSVGRVVVETVPLGSTFQLPYAYTIFFVPQDALPLGTALNECPPIVRAGVPWYGNILVVRHGIRKPVRNMDHGDTRLVDTIVARPRWRPLQTPSARPHHQRSHTSRPRRPRSILGFGAAVWSCATALFWGCRRAGELTLKSANKFDPHHGTCRDTRTSFTNVNGHEVVDFHIIWTKTTTIHGGDCILTQITGDDADICPSGPSRITSASTTSPRH
ncbi:hypothetical protein B0H14DRAFT_3740885 [Mycena olivaceomarginata]|nr:hypothetical protein B0H14DRAFT_3740885 [Mycena olivaceomarginata]